MRGGKNKRRAIRRMKGEGWFNTKGVRIPRIYTGMRKKWWWRINRLDMSEWKDIQSRR